MFKKQFFNFFAALTVFTLFSCSSQLEKSSSLQFAYSGKQVAKLAGNPESTYTLKLELSGDYKAEKELKISPETEEKVFTFEDLSAGMSITADVCIYENVVLRYSKSDSIKLNSGVNTLNLELAKYVSTPNVYIENYADYQYKLSLKQFLSKSKEITQIGETTSEEDEPTSEEIVYTFDSDGNLWTATQNLLSKYSINTETGLYKEKPENSISLINYGFDAVDDITYDIKTGYLYIVTRNGYIHALNPNEYTQTEDNVEYKIYSTEEYYLPNKGFPNQIAVHDNTAYIAEKDYSTNTANITKIYKAKVNFSENENKTYILTFETEETPIKDISSLDILKNHETKSVYIADLQIGDGLGNHTTTLYALAREYTDSIGNSSENNLPVLYPKTVYSRGALVAINLSDGTSSSPTYGWSTTTKNISIEGSNNDSYPGILCAPSNSSATVEFYGPAKFAALVPKKLVILDDGITCTEQNDSFKNKDSLVEFDIAKESLSRTKENLKVSKPTASSFTIEE